MLGNERPRDIARGPAIGNQCRSLELIIYAHASDTAVETGRCLYEGTLDQARGLKSQNCRINGQLPRS